MYRTADEDNEEGEIPLASSTDEYDNSEVYFDTMRAICIMTNNINMFKQMDYTRFSSNQKKMLEFNSMLHVNTVGSVMKEYKESIKLLERTENEIFKAYNLGFVDYLYPLQGETCRTLRFQKKGIMRNVEKLDKKISVPTADLNKPYVYPLHDSAFLNYRFLIGESITYITFNKYKNQYMLEFQTLLRGE